MQGTTRVRALGSRQIGASVTALDAADPSAEPFDHVVAIHRHVMAGGHL